MPRSLALQYGLPLGYSRLSCIAVAGSHHGCSTLRLGENETLLPAAGMILLAWSEAIYK